MNRTFVASTLVKFFYVLDNKRERTCQNFYVMCRSLVSSFWRDENCRFMNDKHRRITSLYQCTLLSFCLSKFQRFHNADIVSFKQISVRSQHDDLGITKEREMRPHIHSAYAVRFWTNCIGFSVFPSYERDVFLSFMYSALP